MQHPDEGTIHSWLDGALPAEEAAGLETHVATCQSCAAAVAEARGFIAASSRILTALDDVPRGVLPAVPERKRDLRVFWRAAAAMLVVAGGSLVVMREGGPDPRVAPSSKQAEALSATTVSPPSAGIAQPTAGIALPGAGSGSSVAEVDKSAAGTSAPLSQAAPRTKTAAARERDLSANAERRQAREPAGGIGSGVAAGAIAPTSAPAPTVVNSPPAAANSSVADLELPLKVLSVARGSGSRQTTYEIAPGQVVTLTEQEPVAVPRAAVTAGQSAASPLVLRDGRAAQPSRAEAAAASPPPPPAVDSRAGTDSAVEGRVAGIAKAPVAQQKAAMTFGAGVQTISWTEAGTGKRLNLTGNVSVERLQEVRRRIEKERAAGVKSP